MIVCLIDNISEQYRELHLEFMKNSGKCKLNDTPLHTYSNRDECMRQPGLPLTTDQRLNSMSSLENDPFGKTFQ